MLVRDKMLSPKDYKGRPTDARDSLCPCRPCFNAHDCGRYNTIGKWLTDMQCATRYNSGCPDNDGRYDAQHVYRGPQGKVCIRCGAQRGPLR